MASNNHCVSSPLYRLPDTSSWGWEWLWSRDTSPSCSMPFIRSWLSSTWRSTLLTSVEASQQEEHLVPTLPHCACVVDWQSMSVRPHISRVTAKLPQLGIISNGHFGSSDKGWCIRNATHLCRTLKSCFVCGTVCRFLFVGWKPITWTCIMLCGRAMAKWFIFYCVHDVWRTHKDIFIHPRLTSKNSPRDLLVS